MSMFDTLNREKTLAMKAKSAAGTAEEREAADLRLSVVRMLLGAISEAETSGKQRTTLNDEQVVSLLKKEAAKRRATAQTFEGTERTLRAQQETWEAEYIGTFLPRETSPEAIEEFIVRYVAETDLPAGGKAIGVVLGALKAEFSSFDTRAASESIGKYL